MSAKKFYETAEFKKLKKEWDKKLESSGFEDIEKNDTDNIITNQIIKTGENIYQNYIDFVEDAGLDYYQYCHQILREFPFKRELDRVVFEMYTEGKTEREISKSLQNLNLKPITQQAINLLIRRILDQNIPKPKSNS
jgi:hypothetical protein